MGDNRARRSSSSPLIYIKSIDFIDYRLTAVVCQALYRETVGVSGARLDSIITAVTSPAAFERHDAGPICTVAMVLGLPSNA